MPKVEQVTQEMPKVVVNDVKPQIYFIKRRTHKFLVRNKLQAPTSTTSKPEANGKLTDKEKEMVSTELEKITKEMEKQYKDVNNAAKVGYIRNHLKVHTTRYLK